MENLEVLLTRLSVLLEEADEQRWRRSLSALAGDARQADDDVEAQRVVRSVLGPYGGMGSFSDVVLQDPSGVRPEQAEFHRLRLRLFEEARRVLG